MTNILFRCDGSPEIGLGHIVRCLALADELRDAYGCPIAFAMRKGPLGIKMIEEKGYHVIASRETDQNFDYGTWLNECIKEVDARSIVLDVRDGLAREVVKKLRNNGMLIATIDDPEDKRLESNMAFYPPVPQIKRLDWTGFTGELHVGWEWVILRREFVNARHFVDKHSKLKTQNSKLRILVTMGGSDPQGMTLKAVKALEMLDEDNFEVVVVLGAGFQHKKQLGNLLSGCKHRFDVQENVQNMAELMAKSDFAIASFGVTAYELAAMGVPAIYLCLTEDHAESASAFVEEGMAISLGVVTQITDSMLVEVVEHQMNDMPKRERAERRVDGQGTIRVALMLAKRVKNIVGGRH